MSEKGTDAMVVKLVILDPPWGKDAAIQIGDDYPPYTQVYLSNPQLQDLRDQIDKHLTRINLPWRPNG